MYIAILTTTLMNTLNQKICSAQGSNPCETYGRCGTFGICNALNDPICSCLQGFNPVNEQEWSLGNWTSGCQRRVRLACEGYNNGSTNLSREDGFLNLEMIKISGYSDRWAGPESECEGRCLRNCSCVGYQYAASRFCLFWSGDLIDIQKSPSETLDSALHVRIADSELGNVMFELELDYQ